MLNPAEGKHSPKDPGAELFELAESLMGPDRIKAEVVGGQPTTEGDHFGVHFVISPGWDDAQSIRTERVRIREIGGIHYSPVTSPWTEISPDGSAITERYISKGGHIFSDRQTTGEYEIGRLLTAIQQGRVIDPSKEIVVDRSSETEPNLPPMRRIFARHSLKFLGRAVTDRVLNSILK